MPISTISGINMTMHSELGEPTMSQTLTDALLDCSDLPTYLIYVCVHARSSLGTTVSSAQTAQCQAQEGDVEGEEGSKHWQLTALLFEELFHEAQGSQPWRTQIILQMTGIMLNRRLVLPAATGSPLTCHWRCCSLWLFFCLCWWL